MSSAITKKIAIFTALIFLLLAGAALLRSDKKKSSTLIHTEAKVIADKSRLDLIENRGFSGNNFLILSQITGEERRGEERRGEERRGEERRGEERRGEERI
ncbi:MAG: hypothetical protein LBL48_11340 [Azoarcus sp.]|jgi:hypothetical protein|nr:hypothetical protein [Azoarcus sp.]